MLLLICGFYTFTFNFRDIQDMTNRTNDMPPASLSFLQQAIPAGSLVFSPDWGSTGTFMLALPERRFMVALSPSYFYEKDPDLYQLWFNIPRQATPDSAQLIRQRFNSRYVLCRNIEKWRPFMLDLSVTPGVKSFVVDNLWVLFDLGAVTK
jgi:hypothetical protein